VTLQEWIAFALLVVFMVALFMAGHADGYARAKDKWSRQ
jgi:hypothetical protein